MSKPGPSKTGSVKTKAKVASRKVTAAKKAAVKILALPAETPALVLPSAPSASVPLSPPPPPLSAPLGTPGPAPTPLILTWEDDPESEGARRISVPVPGDPLAELSINILVASPPPPNAYPADTPAARYWTAREALVRGRDFWQPLMPEDRRTWQTGPNLPVNIDAGVQLNAFYNRFNGLSFYRDREDGRDIYTADSPEIVCHELGHAILDILQPALWYAASFETAAFHEAFGDISALLTGLHQDSLCAHVLDRNGAWIERDSRWTRLGEALGKAINRRDPDRASPQCLRNAANGFYFQKPLTLPTSGPDSQLTREPHSLSRPFVGAFLQALGGLARAGGVTPSVQSLQETSWKAGLWLVSAVRTAPVQPDYFFQIASALVAAAQATGSVEERDVIASAFVRRGILPVEALENGWPNTTPQLASGTTVIHQPGVPAQPASPGGAGFGMAGASMAGAAAAARSLSNSVHFDGKRIGFKAAFRIATAKAMQHLSRNQAFANSNLPQSLSAAASALGISTGPIFTAAASVAAAAISSLFEPPVDHDVEFIHYLFQRGRVEFDEECARMAATGPMYARKTHRLAVLDGEPTLERITFDCGFD